MDVDRAPDVRCCAMGVVSEMDSRFAEVRWESATIGPAWCRAHSNN